MKEREPTVNEILNWFQSSPKDGALILLAICVGVMEQRDPAAFKKMRRRRRRAASSVAAGQAPDPELTAAK